MTGQIKSNWHFKALATCNILAVLLLCSWLYPVTRVLWDRFDVFIFYSLNGTLESGKVWQGFWAVVNCRPFDFISLLVILSVSAFWILTNDREFIGERIIAFFLFALTLLATNLIFQVVQTDILQYRRPSPTRVLEKAIWFRDIVDWIEAKDSSANSFPGDHAFVLFATSVFFWVKGGRRLGLASSILFIPFAVPRLVGGGHWATDALVGSVFMTLLATSWWLGTPIHCNLTRWLTRRAEKPLAFIDTLLGQKKI